MSLFDKFNIFKLYRKGSKKSISDQIDIFIFTAIIILIMTPVFINIINAGGKSRGKPVHLLISSGFEDTFGKKLSESLLRDFSENNPGIRITMAGSKEPDIFIFYTVYLKYVENFKKTHLYTLQ